ncbi:MAG: phosphoribosylformylglycinamidine synthase [Gammaproteobacteria bacterium]
MGGVALSPFRLRKIEECWIQAGGQGQLEGAHFFYFVENDPDPDLRVRLLDLIGANGSSFLPHAGSGPDLLVVPRLGTVSPWSSKATDILERVGLATLGRIERGVGYTLAGSLHTVKDRMALAKVASDPLTESVLASPAEAHALFRMLAPRPLVHIPFLSQGERALVEADRTLGLGLGARERDHLLRLYRDLGRDPTDAELMMWAQIHSEHCRHHIFNSPLEEEGHLLGTTLFGLIQATYDEHPGPVLLAYRDNAAVLVGGWVKRLVPRVESEAATGRTERIYRLIREREHSVIKVETHNHPTAIAPFPGAATGSGGEIRDESATGRGARPRAGLCGFTVSNLRIPGLERSWEARRVPEAPSLASPLAIMLEGPIGSASYNNEFGRPNLLGYFRSFEWMPHDPATPVAYGFHKPVMLAGGIGVIGGTGWRKRRPRAGLAVIVLGGPSFLIGLGGGSQSSRTDEMASGLDWASVQRGNAEMERRTQEVINQLVDLGQRNPIVSIHDVGAGGLANAVPELLWSGRVGARIDLDAIPRHDSGLSPMELWCNESQERYVMALEPEGLSALSEAARRERCPWAEIGRTTADTTLMVRSGECGEPAVAIPLKRLFAPTRRLPRALRRGSLPEASDGIRLAPIERMLCSVLQAPTVADKSFLVTIADRTVGGLSVRDPLVGPYQIPVGDVAVVTRDFVGYSGCAMSLGERPPVALIDPAASARLSIAEAITNLLAADVTGPDQVAFSANWMASAGDPGEEGALYAAVRAASACARLIGIPIPVGKDSLSMRAQVPGGSGGLAVRSPVTLVVSAFAGVGDVRKTLTPGFDPDLPHLLLLVDLSRRPGRLGGSVAAQVMGVLGRLAPDLDDPEDLIRFWHVMNRLKGRGLVRAYHDRSDGGAWASVLEMAFASRAGLNFDCGGWNGDPVRFLLDEAPGALLAIAPDDLKTVSDAFAAFGFADRIHLLAQTHREDRVRIRAAGDTLFEASRTELHRLWSETTHALKRLRDDPEAADEEQRSRMDPDRYRLWSSPPPAATAPVARPRSRKKIRSPRVMVLREQGVNGQVEMAAAFLAAGFTPVDVHMSDLVDDRIHLNDFDVLAACGGFSYGDVLGAGVGWARVILSNPGLRRDFEEFFRRPETLSLGVCNGCQMMTELQSLIPGADDWPRFRRNRSEQFEARLAMVRVTSRSSPWFEGVSGGEWPIVVSHGEGRAVFEPGALDRLRTRGGIALEYLAGSGRATEHYPANPNGSPEGVTGFTNQDGRALILMPHPERSFRSIQLSWHPGDWGEYSPWFRLFENACRFTRRES